MPLIDDISVVPYSTKKGVSQVRSTGSRFSAAIIEALKEQLVACGWNLTGSQGAVGTVSYPTGCPYTAGTGTGLVGCSGTWVAITTPFAVYRYCSYVPGQTPVGVGCFQFPLGTTPAGSLANMCTVISATSPYIATLQTIGGILVVVLTAKLLGPSGNFDAISADGRFGVGSENTSGGGYTLSSVGTSPYSVTMTGIFGFGTEEDVLFSFTLGPSGHTGPAAYALGTSGVSDYTIVANPYSFAIFNGTDALHSLAAFAPCIPTAEGFTGAYCVFIVGPYNLPNQLMWRGGPGDQPCTVSLDAAPITAADNRRNPQVLSLRAEVFPSVTLNGQPLITAAYAMMSGTHAGEPTVVGKLWDCMVLTSPMQIGATLQTFGREYVCIASQPVSGGNTPSSLLFCIDDHGQPDAGLGNSGGSTDTGGSGAGGGTSPSNPTAPPGSGNGSFSGSCTATGVPDDYTVNWASGDKFTSAMVGQTLTVTLFGLAHPWVSAGGSGDATGTLPVVSSVTSPTVLKTTQTLNSSFYGAPYTCP